ncbi:MAG: hypothetical protein HC800_16300 [Phormidesmis sp. RL_2_1]|nr:hypothetical protein [Phormidesmis sp. RL_2_1]
MTYSERMAATDMNPPPKPTTNIGAASRSIGSYSIGSCSIGSCSIGSCSIGSCSASAPNDSKMALVLAICKRHLASIQAYWRNPYRATGQVTRDMRMHLQTAIYADISLKASHVSI